MAGSHWCSGDRPLAEDMGAGPSEFGRDGGAVSARPLVSVIVTNYNYDRFLEEAVRSALNQTYESREVIVVDDGSTDNSRDVLGSFGRDVTPIMQHNQGQACAFNAGVRAARGSVICFLDADDVWHPEKVARVVDDSPAHHTLIYHQMQKADSTLRPMGRPGPTREYDRSLHRRVLRSGGWWSCPPSSALSFARPYLDRVLPVPGTYRICADAYLGSLAPHLGPVRGIFEPLGIYRIHGSNGWTGSARDSEVTLQRRLAQYELQVSTLNESLRTLGLTGQVRLSDHWPHRAVASELRGEFTARDCAVGLRFPAIRPNRRVKSVLRAAYLAYRRRSQPQRFR